MSEPIDPVADELMLLRLPLLYARAADRNLPDLFVSLFTEDAVVDSPGHLMSGRDALYTIPGILGRMYVSTFHAVHNRTVEIAGDTATGETYCIASHLTEIGGARLSKFDMAIRYDDSFVRRGDHWLFSHRKLNVDWTSTMEVGPMPS